MMRSRLAINFVSSFNAPLRKLPPCNRPHLVKSWRVLGLLSGTSMDGIDVAAAEFRLAGDGWLELRPLGCLDVPYPAELRAELLAALPPADCSARQLCRLDTMVGRAFGVAALRGLTELCDGRAELIGSLGQTIYHWIEDGRCEGTLQLGQPAWIAEATGLPVVADLRARDVAAGGHGAPLVGLFDELWLGHRRTRQIALNLGGIANISVVGGGAPPLAYDTGPGNALLDAAARLLPERRERDEGGRLAAIGSPHPGLLSALLADPYYELPPPKSTGKEYFTAEYLTAALERLPEPLDGPDLLATLVELTARTVAQECGKHEATRVVASGGGVHNATLMAALSRHLAPAELITSAELGLPADGKEGYLAALLGLLTFCGQPGNLPAATGAVGPRLLGSITPGRTAVRLPEPWSRQPIGLRCVSGDAGADGGLITGEPVRTGG